VGWDTTSANDSKDVRFTAAQIPVEDEKRTLPVRFERVEPETAAMSPSQANDASRSVFAHDMTRQHAVCRRHAKWRFEHRVGVPRVRNNRLALERRMAGKEWSRAATSSSSWRTLSFQLKPLGHRPMTSMRATAPPRLGMSRPKPARHQQSRADPQAWKDIASHSRPAAQRAPRTAHSSYISTMRGRTQRDATTERGQRRDGDRAAGSRLEI